MWTEQLTETVPNYTVYKTVGTPSTNHTGQILGPYNLRDGRSINSITLNENIRCKLVRYILDVRRRDLKHCAKHRYIIRIAGNVNTDRI